MSPFNHGDTYAREKLRAEIASMYCGDRLGIGHQPQNTAAYVKSWLTALQKDRDEIRKAAADANRIVDYLVRLHNAAAAA